MRRLNLIILVVGVVLICGCSLFKGKVVGSGPNEKDSPLATSSEDPILITVGFLPLKDKRPQEDIRYMVSVREKVSNRVLEMVKGTKIFSEIHYPSLDSDAVVITGEIRKFNWRSYDTMISYVPLLNVFNIFGVPATRTHGEAKIFLVLKDVKTGEVLFRLQEEHIKDSKYSIYSFKDEKVTADLVNSFNIVLDKIRKKLIFNEKIILEIVKARSVIEEAKVSKIKAQEMEAAQEKMDAVEKKVKQVEDKIKDVEEKMKAAEKKIKAAEKTMKAAEQKLKAAEGKAKQHKEISDIEQKQDSAAIKSLSESNATKSDNVPKGE